MVRVAMTGTAAAEPAADGAGAQAPATVGPPGTRRGRPWNSSHRAHMEDCLIAARLAGVSQLRYEVPGYGTRGERAARAAERRGARAASRSGERSCSASCILQQESILQQGAEVRRVARARVEGTGAHTEDDDRAQRGRQEACPGATWAPHSRRRQERRERQDGPCRHSQSFGKSVVSCEKKNLNKRTLSHSGQARKRILEQNSLAQHWAPGTGAHWH